MENLHRAWAPGDTFRNPKMRHWTPNMAFSRSRAGEGMHVHPYPQPVPPSPTKTLLLLSGEHSTFCEATLSDDSLHALEHY